MVSRTADVRLNFSATGQEKVKGIFGQIDAQRKALSNSPVSIKLGANDKEATDKISNLFHQVETLNHSRANISVKLDNYEDAKAKLDELKAKSKAIDGKVVKETIRIDGMGKAILDFSVLAKAQQDQKKFSLSGLFGSRGGSGGSGGSAGSGLLGALPAAQGLVNPYTVVAGLAALPFAAQAAAGGITLAFGAAFTGLAVLGASKAKSVQKSFAKLKTDASHDLVDIGKPFVPVMNSILLTARSTMDKLTPVFTSVVKGISGPFKSFANTFTTTLGGPNMTNALKSLGSSFGSVLKALTPQLPGDINAIADGLKRIGDAVSRNPKAIADFVSGLFRIAGFALDAVAGLTTVATYIEQHFIPGFDRARHDIAGWGADLMGDWKTFIGFFVSAFDSIRAKAVGVWHAIENNFFGKVLIAAVKLWWAMTSITLSLARDVIVAVFKVIAAVGVLAWKTISFAFVAYWNAVLKPTLTVMGAVFRTAFSVIGTVAAKTWSIIGTLFSALWHDVLRPTIMALWTTISSVFGFIINGAARAFGWVPEIGGKLRQGAAAFNIFRDNVNNAINGIKGKTVNVGVSMTAASNPYPGGISGRAANGMFVSQGRAGVDDQLILAQRGEVIVPTRLVNAGAVDHLRGAIPGFASGGQVGISTSTPGAGAIGASIWA
jgi:hypothetical protein